MLDTGLLVVLYQAGQCQGWLILNMPLWALVSVL
jgi:hypothetical protein